MASPRQLFVNIRVVDLGRANAFSDALNLTFDPQFTDENTACMIVNEPAYFMLLTDPPDGHHFEVLWMDPTTIQ